MSTFNKKKHATYWLRCLKTFLPNQYTSMDTNRTMLAFFAISALDILNVLNNSTTVEERASYTEWIYSLQHPQGGFRGSPSMQFGSMAEEDQLRWDTASVPATYFALAMLLILRDDFERVKRDDCLKWLRCMQREDGSFGQTLGYNGSVEGGHDTRFGYVAMGIRWILGGDLPQIASSEVQDINTEKLVMNIRQLQTYDGGFSDVPFHEAHGGYTYCAISALSISNSLDDGIADHELLLRWLIVRQTRNIDPDEDDEEDCKVQFSSPSPIGFNGRCNKVGDTCYTFWIAGALKALGHIDLIDKPSVIEYLVGTTQHFIGGFMKYPGDPPDVYHSYLGLAALGVLEHPDIRPVDPVASFSQSAVEYLDQSIRPKYQWTVIDA